MADLKGRFDDAKDKVEGTAKEAQGLSLIHIFRIEPVILSQKNSEGAKKNESIG